jgi:hypothetical protein
MAETVNIGEIANQLSDEIFSYFGWKAHPKRDDNFPCCNPDHVTKPKTVKRTPSSTKGRAAPPAPKQKDSHPGDVVFYYQDPYLGLRIYLHTDLKSYAKDSVSTTKLRAAIESLAMTVECARCSEEWRKKYSVPDDEPIDVRGLLFVHNHDGKYVDDFDAAVSKTNFSSVPVAPNVYIHFLGPHDISRLFTIANDIVRLQHQKTLPETYSFYYPDLVMWRRHGDVFAQPATIECITAPYFIITYETGAKSPPGYLIYYNRMGGTVDEFEYFLDSLSRYQMLEPGKLIRIRMVSKSPSGDYLSNFKSARERYAKAWGFDESRVGVLNSIQIGPVNAVATTYSAPFIGWREHK